MDESTKKVPVKCKVGFAFGGLGASFSMIIPTFISFFMTESLLVPIAFVSVMIIVIKVIDGFSDIVARTLIDRIRSPKGKARPWFLWASIPYAFFLAAIFWVPPSLPIMQKVILVAIFDALTVSIFGTMINVAKYTLVARISPFKKERELSCKNF